jgi:hypothetical protein
MALRLSALAWIVVGVWLSYTTLQEIAHEMAVRATPPEVTHDLVVRNAADQLGRHATFRVLLFTDEFRWRLASHDVLEDGSLQPNFTTAMRAVLDSAREIICVGASSEELPGGVSYEEGVAREEFRAAKRAEQTAVWVRQALSRPVPVRKLNVGYHAPTRGTRDTSDQRRMVIILVINNDPGADIDQALRTAMARESVRAPIFETLLTRYSLAGGRAFTWVP